MPRPEQTEKATPKRRREARERGQVARSTELAGAVAFLGSIVVLHALGGRTLDGLAETMHRIFDGAAHPLPFTVRSVWLLFAQAFGGFGLVLLFIFAVATAAVVTVNLFEFGFLFTLKPLVPQVSRIDPLRGFQRLFSRYVAVNLAKQFIKLGAVIVLLAMTLLRDPGLLARIEESSPRAAFLLAGDVLYGIALRFGILLVIVGLLDFLYERWQLEENLKMSKQEVKDEMRQAEGSPEIKGAVRRRQREFARRRMMQAVPRATVVVTNPTHYAVALEWDEVRMEAPVVTAKGTDLLARRIREVAREHGVPVLENPPLARTLYEKVELDQAIPPQLYAAVAQVIAFVYRLKRKTIA